MVFDNEWNENTPDGDSIADPPSRGDDRIKEFKRSLSERLKDMIYGFFSSETNHLLIGFKKLIFRAVVKPAKIATAMQVYAKNVGSGVLELFIQDKSGNEIQVTAGGILKSVNLTGVQTVAGIKTFSSIPLGPDEDPTTAHQLTRKSFVESISKLPKVINKTWEGDNTNNREIDLGDDYDFILIFLEEAASGSRLDYAYAFKTAYGIKDSISTGARLQTLANAYFQGKMTGVDVNKIKLGSTGNSSFGTNYLNWTYRLIGFKFSSMES